MPDKPIEVYAEVCKTISNRFDTIDNLKSGSFDSLAKAELCAFNARKVIEGIAFGCLIAVENSIGDVPRDSKGQWNAEKILTTLEKKDLGTAYPSPSIIRQSTPEEHKQHNVKATIEGVPGRRLEKAELFKMYTRMHVWNHEFNPYVIIRTSSQTRTHFFRIIKQCL
jgi:hypothetical protein